MFPGETFSTFVQVLETIFETEILTEDKIQRLKYMN